MKTPTSTRADSEEVLAHRHPFSEQDWNFSGNGVPDRELVPCLLWEFLRESQTARQLVQDWTELFAAPDAATRDQNPLAIRTQSLSVKINHELLIHDFMYSALVMVSALHKLANVPWQLLPPNMKRFLLKPCEQVNEPVFIGFATHAKQLFAEAEKRETEEIANTPDGSTLSLPRARAPLRFFTAGPNWEALCVVVDWGRYDDNAIREGFQQLTEEVIKSRPKGIKPQVRKESGRGNPNEWRGKLNSLGRTRLYCHYDGVDALKRANHLAHKWLVDKLRDKGDRAAMKSLADAKARFVRAFHEILPFEKNHLPFCVERSRFNR